MPLSWASLPPNLEEWVFVDHSCDASLLDTLLLGVSLLYSYFHLLKFEDVIVTSMVFVMLFAVRMTMGHPKKV